MDGRVEGDGGFHPAEAGERLKDVASALSSLVREHVDLARAEAVADLKKAGRDAAGAGAGLLLALLGGVLLSVCACLALGLALGNWAGFLIIGALYAAVGGGLVAAGVRRLKGADRPDMDTTARTLADDRRFAKELRGRLAAPEAAPGEQIVRH
jgi:hypothetical protein